MNNQQSIMLNDILRLDNLSNVKIRFNKSNREDWNPMELFASGNMNELEKGHYWNYKRSRSYIQGQITIGFAKLASKDQWLLFHVGKVIKDLNIRDGVGYEYESLPEYDKYLGRLIIRFENKDQNLVRKAESVIDRCYVDKILPDYFENDIFPGYENVNISWETLKRVSTKDSWISALQNQKGVYLITDRSNGKQYVGSAYGDEMILGRWETYIKNGHGGNKGLKALEFEHIKLNFSYSILEIFKSTTDDKSIIARENWWKKILLSRDFGYNKN
jgi:hypothetical protein